MHDDRRTIRFGELAVGDVGIVGGKNSSLGEMIQHLGKAGIQVPDGFAATASAYREIVSANGLEEVIRSQTSRLDTDPDALREVGAAIRTAFDAATIPEALAAELVASYRALGEEAGIADLAVAVRSSATAEDLPEASFAGQQESYLNVVGADALLAAYRDCVTSLFTDRAIAYREENGFDHLDVALSVGVQRMVRSDRWGAGVMFTLDTESGFPRMVIIDAAWGLGEAVVKGEVDPDRYRVFKPLLVHPGVDPVVSHSLGRKEVKIVYADPRSGGESTKTVACSPAERHARVLDDHDIVALARWAVIIEDHYGRPMDIEWAKDGDTGELFIVQARPETVQAQKGASLVRYTVRDRGRVLIEGLSVGDAAASGPVCVLESAAEADRFPDGGVLVARITDPDWVPVMRKASAVVTDRGGRTSHAAIVSRELGVPAVLGTEHGTKLLRDGQMVTVSCAEGDIGFVYEGEATVAREELDLGALPTTRTHVMLNLANPAAALQWWRLPADGIGLARMEFIVNEHIRVHPMALAHPERVDDPAVRRSIAQLTRDYDSPEEYFVDRLAAGVGALCSAYHPHPTILRLSDFKTNEYAKLLGGTPFEPVEENPMIGWRGASRYYHPGYRDGFALECRAIRRVREELGFANLIVMVPFCRTPAEADKVLAVMAEEGLVRGEGGLQVYVMAEIPSNVILAEEFCARFDGFSIGSNDLTQLTLGVDRDSEILASSFGADDAAVVTLIRDLIARAHAQDTHVGFCGQAPSNDPTYARLLVDAGIDSVSVTPDSFVAVKTQIAAAEVG
ncbi:MAG: phosphoenolpyruvate synthase [Acidimicrobiales bacterium]|nr:phosphoenolpyruvate synthase [Acidimicrobiales bacterium]